MKSLAMNSLVSYGRALEKQMESVANNLSNVDTTGYKQDQPAFRAMMANAMGTPSVSDEEQFYHYEHIPPYGLLRQHFTATADMGKDYSEGSMIRTGNPLDFALTDKTSFFSVTTPQGERYTRAGNFRLDDNHRLITAEGVLVNGKDGPLVLKGNEISLSADGSLQVDGKKVGGLKIVTFPHPERLQKLGNSLFAPVDEGNLHTIQENVHIVQGTLEGSNVETMKEMVRMIEANQAYASMQKAIASEDEINKKAITLAEV